MSYFWSRVFFESLDDFTLLECLQGLSLQTYRVSKGVVVETCAPQPKADFRVIHQSLPAIRLGSHRGLTNMLFPRPWSLLMIDGLTVETEQRDSLQDWRSLGRAFVLAERRLSGTKFVYVLLKLKDRYTAFELSYSGYRCMELKERSDLNHLWEERLAGTLGGDWMMSHFGSETTAFFWDISALQQYRTVGHVAESLISSLNNEENFISAIPGDPGHLSSSIETDNPLPA